MSARPTLEHRRRRRQVRVPCGLPTHSRDSVVAPLDCRSSSSALPVPRSLERYKFILARRRKCSRMVNAQIPLSLSLSLSLSLYPSLQESVVKWCTDHFVFHHRLPPESFPLSFADHIVQAKRLKHLLCVTFTWYALQIDCTTRVYPRNETEKYFSSTTQLV